MKPLLLLITLLAACGDTKTSDSATGITGDTATADTSSDGDDTAATCNDDNEDCAPGTCGGEGGRMLPGANCLACHDGSDGEAPRFTAAGTVFADAQGTAGASGVTVRITDADGAVTELTTNEVGNFYTRDAMVFPISGQVELNGNVLSMGTMPDQGGCNACHACSGPVGGKLFAQ